MSGNATGQCAWCGEEQSAEEDWVWLDMPRQGLRMFCAVQCLYLWLLDHAEIGFRALKERGA